MGLDMYIFLKEEGDKSRDVEVAYWRKHPNLHGFFTKKWEDLGYGKKDDFNGNSLELTDEIVDEAIFKIIMNALPSTDGFFFGESEFTAEAIDFDISTLKSVQKLIRDGKKVYYYADW